MTQIIKLSGVENTEDFMNLVTDKELIIFEDIQGSKIFVKYDGDKFIIKPKSIKSDALNFIDLTVQKFYNMAFNYFHSLPGYVIDLMSKSWWFCFEYFPPYDACPANIEYAKNPRNNLILNCIVKGNKYKYDYAELQEYANLFDCDCLPVIFMGKLNQKQLEVIQEQINQNSTTTSDVPPDTSSQNNSPDVIIYPNTTIPNFPTWSVDTSGWPDLVNDPNKPNLIQGSNK